MNAAPSEPQIAPRKFRRLKTGIELLICEIELAEVELQRWDEDNRRIIADLDGCSDSRHIIVQFDTVTILRPRNLLIDVVPIALIESPDLRSLEILFAGPSV